MSIREDLRYKSKGEYDSYVSHPEPSKVDKYAEYYIHVALERKNNKLKQQLRNLQHQNTKFLNDIDNHPTLKVEWDKFRALFKVIEGNEPPLTKSR